MAYVRLFHGDKATVLKVPDEKCNHGLDILIEMQRRSGEKPNDDEAWERAMALRAKHAAEDTEGIYA